MIFSPIPRDIHTYATHAQLFGTELPTEKKELLLLTRGKRFSSFGLYFPPGNTAPTPLPFAKRTRHNRIMDHKYLPRHVAQWAFE